MTRTLVHSREDSLFQALVIAALCLEIVVFIEPAPVDAIILLGLLVGLGLRKFSFEGMGTLPLVSLVAFCLANLVSMYDPLDPERAVFYVLVTLYLVASWFFFVGLAGRYGKPFMATMINAYCIAGLVSALLGIAGYFHLVPFWQQLLLADRARGFFKDCNVYGPFLVPPAIFALSRVVDGRIPWREKAAPVLMIVTSFMAMFLSFSRACWANCGIAAGIYLCGQLAFPGLRRELSPKELRSRIRIGAAVVVGGVLAVGLLMLTSAVSDMVEKRVTSNGLQYYDRIRFATQSIALDTAKERPLGIGPGQAEVMFDYATHSLYVRLLSENGVLGLLSLLVFILATMARCITVIQRGEDLWFREVNLIVLACIAGHLFNSFVIDTVHWRHIWFIYALPWAPVRLRKYPFRMAARSRAAMTGGHAFAAPGFTGR
jgi:O-antigen ligase